MAGLMIAFLVGCTSSTFQATNVTTANINQRSGEETAANLTRQYNNTAANCGSSTTPAFLCSGVTLRITKTSPNYDPWEHSDFSRETDAVSFSFLRADTKFVRTPWGGTNGLVFYPYFSAPSDKIRPEVICYFPLDGATFYRTAPGQFGCRDSIITYPFPGVSRPCREQNITTAEEWIAHYRNPAGSARPNAYSCSFMVRNELNAEAVQAFNQAIRVRGLLGATAFADHNELRIKAWPENQPAVLPIEAFFYTVVGSTSGLANARIDQQKYHDRTNGLVVPIIRLTLPAIQADNATFSYNAADQAVLPTPTKPRPLVLKAYKTTGNEQWLRMADIYTDDVVNVEVPHYTGMDKDDTLKPRWEGRVNYSGAVTTVGNPPGKRLIPIPRMEVIDNIGRTVDVGYSVKEKGTGDTIESEKLTLHIDPQAVTLPPPTYSGSTVLVNVGQAGYTVGVRWVGVTTHDTAVQNVVVGQVNTFAIDNAWITENRGKTVLINYSIKRSDNTGDRMFSWVLRVPL
ncbi:hypothetical protein [Pseudomonas sp. MWU12-2319]|uniref:hypothetical protein n=1 Tax=Pseudomonas sp. MWU12-2319 TaxID=2929052 RepID=UPI00128C0C31|nr:hypothetical protein [Pseudomonas sp. MWU12-2319]MPQ66169.1 hypothetical protein [Pseudomonas sp. MWU12-2323]